MKTKILCGIITILLGFALLQYVRKTMKVAGTDQMSLADNKEQIWNATLQIRMEIPHLDQDKKGVMLRAKGLGSLVQMGEDILLVTHNHWGEILHDSTVVEIRGAGNQLLKVMSGSEFKSLVRYQDAGTLILQAPDGMALQPATLCQGNAGELQPGEVVSLAYRQTPDLKNVAIIEATVETVFTFQGLPAYILRSVSGEPIKGGDSGGGVWHEGQLVGNLWATVELEKNPIMAVLTGDTEPPAIEPTNKSYAAILPAIPPMSYPVAGSANGVRAE